MPRPAVLLYIGAQPERLDDLRRVDGFHVHPSSAEAAASDLARLACNAGLIDANATGLEVARRLRVQQAALPLLFLVADDSENFDFEAAAALGGVDFIGVPLIPALLRVKLGQLAQSPPARAEGVGLQPGGAFWQAMLAAIDEAVVAADTGGRIVFINAEAERLTGWPRADALGRPLGEVVRIEEAPPPSEAVQRLTVAHELRAPKLLIGRDGTRRPSCEVLSAITTPAGEAIGSIVTFRDLTWRQRIADLLVEVHSDLEQQVIQRTAELNGERSFLAAVLDAIEDGVVACDADGMLTVFNRASREFHGIPASPLPAEQWSDHYRLFRADGVTPLPKEEIPLFRALLGERVHDAEMVIESEAGPRTINCAGQPLREASGKLLGAVVSMHDISLREQMRVARDGAIREQVRREAAEAAAESLAESRERFELLLESSGEGIYGMADDGRCTFLNQAGARMLGLQPEEVLGQDMHALIHHHHADSAAYSAQECRIRDASRQGTVLRVDDEVFWHRDGTAIPVSYTVHPALYKERRVGAVVNFSDITVRRAAEERLKASEERVRLATDAADLGIWLWDAAADEVTWENERPYSIFGVSHAEGAINAARFFAEFVHPDDAARFEERLGRSVATGERLRVEARFYRRGDGELRWAEFTGIVRSGADGAPTHLLGTVADITERKRADEQSRIREERYHTLFSSMDEGFCIIECIFDDAGEPIDYRFLEYNPAFEVHTGLTGVLGQSICTLYPDFDRHWVNLYGRVAQTGQSIRTENESVAMGRWFDVYATRLGEPGSKQVACLFNDITVRKRAEVDLRRLADDLAEQDRRKTEFLATLAHELRNPLAPLRNGLHLLARAGGDAERFARARDMMERQLVQMVRLVDDLLDVARITRGKVELKRERVAVQSVVANAVETAMPSMEAARHALSLDLPAQPLMLDADPIRLAQVVGNLLNNAAKYTPRGGSIRVTARLEEGEAVLSVSDNGIGIPSESLSSVFDMFTQVGRNMERAQGGLGIGLTLVRRLVELHGGTASVYSAGVDRGSEFTLRLPLAATDEPAAASPAVVAASTPPRSLRILVADDNVDAAESMAGLLEMSGHTTRLAHDGFQAVRAAVEFRPHVAFLDIGMPGKNGYEVAQSLRQEPELGAVLLVALTGWGSEDDRALSRQAGFDRHLTKPAELEAIERMLDEVTAAAGDAAESAGPPG